MTQADPWAALAGLTAARIALGRAGASLPTEAVLRFDVAHALARDAVHTPLDLAALAERWQAMQGEAAVIVHSRAGDRHIYLQRPDLGRQLDEDSAARLSALTAAESDFAIVVADGLSATGVAAHACCRACVACAGCRWCWPGRAGWRSATKSVRGSRRDWCWCCSANGRGFRHPTASAPT
jgi:ethanolamine ammonia-lyase small subunit